jgi:glutaredoxin
MKTQFFLIFFLLLISIILTACTGSGSITPGKYQDFALCLSENDVTMFGTEWCSHCKNQKALFGNDFAFVDYVDCERNRDECLRNGVTGYPTWKINSQYYSGEQPLERLASLSGCSLE